MREIGIIYGIIYFDFMRDRGYKEIGGLNFKGWRVILRIVGIYKLL